MTKATAATTPPRLAAADVDRLVAEATRAVDAFEATPPGALVGDALARHQLAAWSGIVKLEEAARLRMFTEDIHPVTADDLALFEFAVGVHTRQDVPEVLIDLHRRSLTTHPTFAALIRGPLVHHRVGELATWGIAGDTLEQRDRALTHFQHELARTMVGHADFEPWATHLAETIPALDARVRAAAQRHRDHAEAQRQRIEAEEAAAEAAIAAEASRRREALAAWFSARHGLPYQLGSRLVTGGQLAEALRRHRAFDTTGTALEPLTDTDVGRLDAIRHSAELSAGVR